MWSLLARNLFWIQARLGYIESADGQFNTTTKYYQTSIERVETQRTGVYASFKSEGGCPKSRKREEKAHMSRNKCCNETGAGL